MKYLAVINSEFIKEARKWQDLTYEEQKGYLSRHPKTKRKLTAKPEVSKSKVIEPESEPEQINEDLVEKQDTPVRAEIIKACEPLLTYLVNQANTYFDSKIEQFEDHKAKHTEPVVIYRFVRDFVGQNDLVRDLISSIYKSKEQKNALSPDYLKDYTVDENRKKAFYKRSEQLIREFNLQKLRRVVARYISDDFTKIDNVRVQRGTQGFEITANLQDNQDRQWSFETRAIPAGGYNIQEFHYRYIVNLSSPEVPRDAVRKKITEAERAEKEKRREQRSSAKQQKEKERKAKLVTNAILGLKRVIKDWNESGQDACRGQVTRGVRSQADYNDIEKSIGRISQFLNEKDVMDKKRNEIVNQAEHNNISYDYFDPIKDLLEHTKPFVFTPDWEYRNLKRIGS